MLVCALLAAQEATAVHQTPTTVISISNAQALAFGKFAAGSGGSVTVAPGGARSATGGVALLSSSSGAAAKFTVSGDANLTYAISLPADGTVVLASGGGQTMPLNNFTSSPGTTGQLNASGSQTVSVGATLHVGSNQAPGSYSGAFDVMIDYD